jgi:hypothetical protein
VTNKALTAEILQLKETVAGLQAEMRLLRCDHPPVDEASLTTLLEYLHGTFGSTSFLSKRVFEEAELNKFLYAALVRCLGPEPNAQGLSKMLIPRSGQHGEFMLRCIKKRTNAGARFVVKHSFTSFTR